MPFLDYAGHWKKATFADETALRAASVAGYEDGDQVCVTTTPHVGVEAVFVWESGHMVRDYPEIGVIRPNSVLTDNDPGRWVFHRYSDDIDY